MIKCPTLEKTAAPSAVACVDSRLQAVTLPILFSMLLMAACFWYAKQDGAGISEYDLTVRSAQLACVAMLPVWLQSLLSKRSSLERVVILAWLPLKICFLIYYYFYVWDARENPSLYLHYSDHMPFHQWANRVSEYWRVSSGIIISRKQLYIMSINYPAAAYLFGAMYHCLGKFPGVVLPWLTLFQFYTAVTAQRVLELADLPLKEAKVAFYFMLWSPVVWILTLLIHRDIFIILALLIIVGATLSLFRRSPLGLLGVPVGVVLLANLRAELLILVMVWFVLVCLIGVSRYGDLGFAKKLAFFAVFGSITAFVGWTIFGGGSSLYSAKFAMGSKMGQVSAKYMQEGATGNGMYGGVLALGGAFLLPVILPFKLLIGLTAPFPWRFSTVQLAITQPFYSLESILRIALAILMVRSACSWARLKEIYARPSFLPVSMGVVLALGSLMGPQSEVRYMTPAFPLLVPLFGRQASSFRTMFSSLCWAVFAIALLHAGYLLFRGGF